MAKTKTSREFIDSSIIAMLVVIMVVISALIVATITQSSVFTDIPSTSSHTVTNETSAWINSTGYTLDAYNTSTSGFTITAIWNATDNGEGTYNLSIPTGNATVSSLGVVTNSSSFIWENVSLSYTYTYSVASGTSLAGLNVTEISNDFGTFVTNLIAFLAVIGTIVGVVWLVMYVRKLFDRKDGLQAISA